MDTLSFPRSKGLLAALFNKDLKPRCVTVQHYRNWPHISIQNSNLKHFIQLLTIKKIHSYMG